MRNFIVGGPEVSNGYTIVLVLKLPRPPTKVRTHRNEKHFLEMRNFCHRVARDERILNEIELMPRVLPLFLEFCQPFATQRRRTLMNFRTFGELAKFCEPLERC